MGCDGGTIPRRDELVRLKKKPEQKDKDAEREFRWLHCALNQQRLQEPIVMCGLGRLYSKQNVIEQLLEKDKMPEAAKHIKSMKDIKQLNLTSNPAYTEADKTEGLLDNRHAPYICKLIGLEMSGKFRFVALWSCGCVISERALKEIKGSSSGNCPLCQQPFAVEDVVVLNAADEDLDIMKVKMEMRQAKRKSGKKDKKSKTKNADLQLKEEINCSLKSLETPSTSKSEFIDACHKQSKLNENSYSSSQSIELPSTSGSEIKLSNNNQIKQNGNAKSSSHSCKIVANPKRLGVTSGAFLEDPELKRLKTDYSVAKDPKASDVYKSLFTSHKSEQEQTRAHWVTYNPFYN